MGGGVEVGGTLVRRSVIRIVVIGGDGREQTKRLLRMVRCGRGGLRVKSKAVVSNVFEDKETQLRVLRRRRSLRLL